MEQFEQVRRAIQQLQGTLFRLYKDKSPNSIFLRDSIAYLDMAQSKISVYTKDCISKQQAKLEREKEEKARQEKIDMKRQAHKK